MRFEAPGFRRLRRAVARERLAGLLAGSLSLLLGILGIVLPLLVSPMLPE